jgi:hypothetical protein
MKCREQTSDDIRKGFKFTKKSAQVVGASETIAFDDLEEEVSTPIGKRGRIQIDDNKAGMTMKNQKNANALSYSGSPKAKEINSLVDTIESVMPVEISKDSTGKKRKTSPDNFLLGLRASQSSKNAKADEATSSGAAVKRRSTNGKKGTQEVNSHVQKTVVEAEKIEESINHTSSSAKANEIQKKIVTKAYYPKINYDPLKSKVLSDSTVNESSHTNILSKLVKEICEIESIGLKEYSDENKGRESIIAALQEVLSQLPEEILSACNDDMTFLPELSVDEKEETESLKRTLYILKKQSVELEKYESNISELGRHYNLWIDGVPENVEGEIYLNISICMFTCICIHECIYIYVYIYIYTYIFVYLYIYMYMHIYKYAHIYKYIYVYIHIYICI